MTKPAVSTGQPFGCQGSEAGEGAGPCILRRGEPPAKNGSVAGLSPAPDRRALAKQTDAGRSSTAALESAPAPSLATIPPVPPAQEPSFPFALRLSKGCIRLSVSGRPAPPSLIGRARLGLHACENSELPSCPWAARLYPVWRHRSLTETATT